MLQNLREIYLTQSFIPLTNISRSKEGISKLTDELRAANEKFLKNLRHLQNLRETMKTLFSQYKYRRDFMKFRFLLLPFLNGFCFDEFVFGIVDVRGDAEFGIR